MLFQCMMERGVLPLFSFSPAIPGGLSDVSNSIVFPDPRTAITQLDGLVNQTRNINPLVNNLATKAESSASFPLFPNIGSQPPVLDNSFFSGSNLLSGNSLFSALGSMSPPQDQPYASLMSNLQSFIRDVTSFTGKSSSGLIPNLGGGIGNVNTVAPPAPTAPPPPANVPNVPAAEAPAAQPRPEKPKAAPAPQANNNAGADAPRREPANAQKAPEPVVAQAKAISAPKQQRDPLQVINEQVNVMQEKVRRNQSVPKEQIDAVEVKLGKMKADKGISDQRREEITTVEKKVQNLKRKIAESKSTDKKPVSPKN